MPRDETRVVLNPGFNALYYSFYLEGLRRTAVRSTFSARRVPCFGHHGLSLVARRGGEEIKLFISASDGTGINAAAIGWCDRYAKVNLDSASLTDSQAAKAMAIGPSFPVRVWSPPAAWIVAARTALVCRSQLSDLREHLANYRRQYRYRLPESAYRPGASDAGYIFFAARLWMNEARTNRLRANFLEACRMSGLEIEGGFVPRSDGETLGFDHLLVPGVYPIADYMRGIRRSLLVFNTPAVDGCHGWKLAEYLALGKAIVSTPLIRDLPAPIEHGVHAHFVDGSIESIRHAVGTLRSDAAYRRSLEAGARRYYDEHLAPTAVLRRCLAPAEPGRPQPPGSDPLSADSSP